MKAVHWTWRRPLIALLVAVGGAVVSGCGGGNHEARVAPAGGSINVAIVDTPNTQDLARLTPSLFTAKSHINVNYTILDEGTLREVVTSGVSARGRQFDVVMIGPYEAPQFGKDGYIADLTPRATSEKAYHLDDVIPSIRKALSYRRQALRVAVLWGVVVPDVPQGCLEGRRHRDARTPHVGAGRGRSPAGSTRPAWPASACAASRAGASSAHRSPPC